MQRVSRRNYCGTEDAVNADAVVERQVLRLPIGWLHWSDTRPCAKRALDHARKLRRDLKSPGVDRGIKRQYRQMIASSFFHDLGSVTLHFLPQRSKRRW